MHAIELRQALQQWAATHCGYEARPFLSISEIGECPSVLYTNLADRRPEPTLEQRLLFYDDAMRRVEIRARLAALNLLQRGEFTITAEFGFPIKVIGHPDGVLTDGSLLKVKPSSFGTLKKIHTEGRIPRYHHEQVQMYLRHARIDVATVVYIIRDNGLIWVERVFANKEMQSCLDQKARMLLRSVATKSPAPCTCGRHDGSAAAPERRAYSNQLRGVRIGAAAPERRDDGAHGRGNSWLARPTDDPKSKSRFSITRK